MAGNVSPQDSAAARFECVDLVYRMFRHYDRRDHEGMYALMTPDATWNRPDGLVQIGPSMQAAMDRRSKTMTVTHLLTNMTAEMAAADLVKVQGLMTVIRDDKGALSPPPAKVGGINSIIEFTVDCRPVGGDWRIHAIDVTYLFKA